MTSTIHDLVELKGRFLSKLEQDWAQLQSSSATPTHEQLYATLQQTPLLPQDQSALLDQPNMITYLSEGLDNNSSSELIQFLSAKEPTLYQLKLNYLARFIENMSQCTISEDYLRKDLFTTLIQIDQFCKRELERALSIQGNIVDIIGNRYQARYYPSLTILDIAHNTFSRD